MENEKFIKNLLLNEYPHAVRSGQIEKYLKLFEDDVTWIPDGGPSCHSKKEIDVYLTGLYCIFKVNPVVEIDKINFCNGLSSAYVIGKNHAQFTPMDGSEIRKSSFRVMWYLLNGPEGWKISRQIWNTLPTNLRK